MSMITRRKFIQGTAVCGLASCFMMSNSALADWPAAVFSTDKKQDVIKDLFGGQAIQESSLVTIKAPEIAENGAVVPISVKANLPHVESISIVVDNNPKPLAAQFILTGKNQGSVGTRIKLREQSNVTAIIKADGKLYSSTKFIKVTKGGCGGG